MPLNDMQIRRAKPEAKTYTLGDGQVLSLLIEPNGSKSWRFRYRFAGKPKMISLGVYPTITLADARSHRHVATQQSQSVRTIGHECSVVIGIDEAY